MYRYRQSGRGGVDAIFVSKEGRTEGGFPLGFVIPIGYCHIDGYWDEMISGAEKNGMQMYVAKHCDNKEEMTHIVPDGTVNRFGIFFTKEKMPEGDWCLDVGKGKWFTRKNFASISGAFDALAEQERKEKKRNEREKESNKR